MRPTPKLSHYDATVLWFRQRMPSLSDEEFAKVIGGERVKALIGARVSHLNMASEVFGEIAGAVARGETLNDFKSRMRERLQDRYSVRNQDQSPQALDLAFVNTTQRAYNAGRINHYLDPKVLARRPIWAFDAVLDGRTSVICRKCSGTVLPADYVWWRTHVPPLHHRCRSTVRALTPDEALAEGPSTGATRMKPEDGWGDLTFDGSPDLRQYPPRLRRHFKRDST